MPRFRIGVCEWSLPPIGPSVCRLAAEAGLEGVELDMGGMQDGMKLTSGRIRKMYAEEAKRTGILYPALAMNVLGACTLLHPENAEERETVFELFDEALQAADELEIPVIQVPSFYTNAMTNAREMEASAFYFSYACKAAERYGIVIGTENTLPAEDQLRLLRMVGYSNFKIYFDTQNPVVFHAGNPAEMFRTLSGSVCQIHVKDGTDERMGTMPLGEGKGFFPESMRSIAESGYEGWIVTENEYKLYRQDNEERLKKDIAALRAALETAGEA